MAAFCLGGWTQEWDCGLCMSQSDHLGHLGMYWVGREGLFSGPHLYLLLCRLDSVCKLQNISSDELGKKKKREIRCDMDPAGGNRREARGPLCSLFLKARFWQPADSVNVYPQFKVRGLADPCSPGWWVWGGACGSSSPGSSQGAQLATAGCWIGGRDGQHAEKRTAAQGLPFL